MQAIQRLAGTHSVEAMVRNSPAGRFLHPQVSCLCSTCSGETNLLPAAFTQISISSTWQMTFQSCWCYAYCCQQLIQNCTSAWYQHDVHVMHSDIKAHVVSVLTAGSWGSQLEPGSQRCGAGKALL